MNHINSYTRKKLNDRSVPPFGTPIPEFSLAKIDNRNFKLANRTFRFQSTFAEINDRSRLGQLGKLFFEK